MTPTELNNLQFVVVSIELAKETTKRFKVDFTQALPGHAVTRHFHIYTNDALEVGTMYRMDFVKTMYRMNFVKIESLGEPVD